MEGKVIVLVVIGVCVVLGLGFWLMSDVRTSPSSLPTCHVLQEGTGGPAIVFFGSKEETERYMNALYQVAPFDEARDKFSVSYIDSYRPACELYKGVALLCYSRELVQQAAACSHDYIVVLHDEVPPIRSSAFKEVLSLNTAHPFSVFAHEFGHAFGNFAEEYTPASLPVSSPNCKYSCDVFAMSDGCYQGCSETGYYRSIDSGIMRSLTAMRYGSWHENYLRGLLGVSSISSVTGHASAPLDCASQSYSLVTLQRTAHGLEVVSIAPGQGCGEDIVSLDDASFRVFTDVQEDGSETISGETYGYEGMVYAAVSDAVSTLTLTQNGQITGEVHLGATLCKA